MRKTILTSAFIISTLFILFFIISSLKPTILIHNKTSHNVYIYFGESTYGVDPSVEEVDKMMKRRTDKLMPGQKITLTPSLKRLLPNDSQVDIGWYVGGRYAYNSISDSGQSFIISKYKGDCSISIFIEKNEVTLKKENKTICYQKLMPFKQTYDTY